MEQPWAKYKVQFKVQELHSESLKETYQNTRHQSKPVISRWDGLLALKETLILCGFEGFFKEYVPVFLTGKMYIAAGFSRIAAEVF